MLQTRRQPLGRKRESDLPIWKQKPTDSQKPTLKPYLSVTRLLTVRTRG